MAVNIVSNKNDQSREKPEYSKNFCLFIPVGFLKIKGNLPIRSAKALAFLLTYIKNAGPQKPFYSIPVRDIVDSLGLGPTKSWDIKKIIKSLQRKVAIERMAMGPNGSWAWRSQMIFPDVGVSSRGLVTIAVYEKIKQEIFEPDQFIAPPLYEFVKLKHKASLIIYELGWLWVGTHHGSSGWYSWETWRDWLLGDSICNYKKFRERYLLPAIQEVNRLTSLDIQEPQSRGRPIMELRLIVRHKRGRRPKKTKQAGVPYKAKNTEPENFNKHCVIINEPNGKGPFDELYRLKSIDIAKAQNCISEFKQSLPTDLLARFEKDNTQGDPWRNREIKLRFIKFGRRYFKT